MTSFHEALRASPVYSVPRIVDGIEGADFAVTRDAPVAFKFAGNWYVSPKKGENVSANPKDWSLVVADTNGDGNLRHYHAPDRSVNMDDAHLEQLSDIANGLNVKEQAGTLEAVHNALAPEQMAKIVLAKEQEGAGFVPGNGEALHAYMAKHGLEAFNATQEELNTARSRDLVPDNCNAERLLLKLEKGDAFELAPSGGVIGKAMSNPRKRVFFVFDKEAQLTSGAAGAEPQASGKADLPLKRIEVGFDEILAPDGGRSYRSRLSETTAHLADVKRELDAADVIVNAPEGITAYVNGDAQGLERYARSHLAMEFDARQFAENYSKKAEGNFYASATHANFGEEVSGEKLTNQAWYRVVRDSDYVPEHNVAARQGEGLTEAVPRVLDRNRADYFIVREHPDYSAMTLANFDSKVPKYELLFFKGAPEGGAPHAMEEVTCKRTEDVYLALHERGIHHDSKLMKLGQEEYADFFNERGLSQYIDDFKLRRQTVKDTVQSELLKGMDSSPKAVLEAPIAFAEGKLTGDVEKLSRNTLYQLGDNHYVLAQTHSGSEYLTLFEKTDKGFELRSHFNTVWNGEFEYNLVDLIHQHGGLKQASMEDTVALLRHCRDEENFRYLMTFDALTDPNKPLLGEEMTTRLRQEAAGTLDSDYVRLAGSKEKEAFAASHRAAAEASAGLKPAAEPVVEPTAASGAATAEKKVETSIAEEAKTAKNWMSRFMQEEKWMGKKGLAFGGAAVALGAVAYGAKKYLNSRHQDSEQASWAERTDAPSSPSMHNL